VVVSLQPVSQWFKVMRLMPEGLPDRWVGGWLGTSVLSRRVLLSVCLHPLQHKQG
jgi:hypothetical protein